jgi:hypothetical protein
MKLVNFVFTHLRASVVQNFFSRASARHEGGKRTSKGNEKGRGKVRGKGKGRTSKRLGAWGPRRIIYLFIFIYIIVVQNCTN